MQPTHPGYHQSFSSLLEPWHIYADSSHVLRSIEFNQPCHWRRKIQALYVLEDWIGLSSCVVRSILASATSHAPVTVAVMMQPATHPTVFRWESPRRWLSIRIHRAEEIDRTERDPAVVSHQQIPIDLPRTIPVSTQGRVCTAKPKFDRC
jgi:hypothetical protein